MSLRLPSIDDSGSGGTIILHERARRYEWSGAAPFSLKWFPAGSAMYEVDGSVVRLDHTRALVVGDDVDYRIRIDGDQETESLCLFFEPGLVTDVARNLGSSTEALLDDPSRQKRLHVADVLRSWPVQGPIRRHLSSLRHLLHGGAVDADLALDIVSNVLLEVSTFGDRVAVELEQLSAVKPSTRQELYRRLHLAREYIRSSFSEPLSVREIARTSMLSPTHLTRNFRALFGETPRSFLIRVRINEARALLLRGDLNVTEVCLAVGYESVGSFSRLYKSVFGVSPVDERQRRRRKSGAQSPTYLNPPLLVDPEQ